jgi:hypothetical protein
MFLVRMGPNVATNTEAIVSNQAMFYGTWFSCIRILLKNKSTNSLSCGHYSRCIYDLLAWNKTHF